MAKTIHLPIKKEWFVLLLIVYLDYAVFGLIIENEKVVDAAPIAKWTIGKNWVEVGTYYRQKKKANFKLIK